MNQFNSNSDQDEFQFKPLTDGLGFHKKAEPKKTTATPAANQTFSATYNLNSNLDINPPLPRKGQQPQPATARAPQTSDANKTVNDILKTLNEKRSYDFSSDKQRLHEAVPVTYKTTRWDLSASLLDAMLITATTLLCLIVLLMVTKVDLFANLSHPDEQGLLYLSLVSLISSITWMYLVGTRVALGFTPGEWVFDQRLGLPEEQHTTSYILKVIARSTIVIATGYVLFPLLSFLFNRDLLGQLLNQQLMKKV